jgi:hypothetical protein
VRVPGTCREISLLSIVVLSPAETGGIWETQELTKCTKDDSRPRLSGAVYEYPPAVLYRFADEFTGLWECGENIMLVVGDIDMVLRSEPGALDDRRYLRGREREDVRDLQV